MDLWVLFISGTWRGVFQLQPVPSITSGLYVVNLPLIILTVVVVVLLIYRYIKRIQIESSKDEGWLENETTSGQ